MAVPAKMSDLSTLAASNSPTGSDAIGNSLDDYLRSHAAIIRSTNAISSATIASASTTDLGSSDGEAVTVTGTTTITSFGTTPAGILREVTFSGALTITNSAAISIQGGTNYVTTAGDILYFRSLGSGNWKQVTSPAIGYRPVNKAGDAMTGDLSVVGNLTASNVVIANNSRFNGAVGTVILQPGSGSGTVTLRPTNESTAGQAVLDSTGKLLLSPTSGAATGLQVAGQIAIQSTGTNAALQVYDVTNGGQIKIVSAGATTSKTVRVNTNGAYEIVNAAYSAVIYTMNDSGDCTARNFTATSDKRKKRKIRKRPARDRLADLLVFCEWLWRDSGEAGVGVIAQEVQKVAPEYVHEAGDGMLSVDKASLALECVIGLAGRVRALEAG